MENQPDNSTGVEPTQAPRKKSNKKIIIIISVIVAVLLVLSIIGTIVAKFITTKVIETGIEKLTDGKVNIDTSTGETTIKSEDGESSAQVGSNVKIPSDFPSDIVPIFSGATVVSSIETPQDGGKSHSIGLSIKGDYQNVVDFYTDVFNKNGWAIQMTNSSNGLTLLTALNTDRQLSGSSYISQGDDGVITVNLTTAPESASE